MKRVVKIIALILLIGSPVWAGTVNPSGGGGVSLPVSVANGGTGSAIGFNKVNAQTVVANAVTCDWSLGNICTFASSASATVTMTNLPTNQRIEIQWAASCNQCTLTFGANVSYYFVTSNLLATGPTVPNSPVNTTTPVTFW